MAYFVNTVVNYRVRYYGASSKGPRNLKARLYLYGPGHKTGVVGTIAFYPPEVLASKQDHLDNLGRPRGHMAIAEIGGVIDMLRHENRVHVHWSERWQQLLLDTEKEPIGEEEP